jgi:hypothetical protein
VIIGKGVRAMPSGKLEMAPDTVSSTCHGPSFFPELRLIIKLNMHQIKLEIIHLHGRRQGPRSLSLEAHLPLEGTLRDAGEDDAEEKEEDERWKSTGPEWRGRRGGGAAGRKEISGGWGWRNQVAAALSRAEEELGLGEGRRGQTLS